METDFSDHRPESKLQGAQEIFVCFWEGRRLFCSLTSLLRTEGGEDRKGLGSEEGGVVLPPSPQQMAHCDTLTLSQPLLRDDLPLHYAGARADCSSHYTPAPRLAMLLQAPLPFIS